MGTSTNVTSGADSHNRLRLRHFYDSHGNLDVLHEQYNGSSTTDTHSFAYDDQNRLTAGFGSNTFAYDSSGRLTSFAGLSPSPSNSQPVHAPYRTSSFAYDANGNMVNKPFYTLTWDHENRLASATGSGTRPTENYLYDADGMRVKKTSDGVETYYPFPHYELHDGVAVKYYFFGGMRIAQRRGSALITYLHGNHLGSTVLETSVIGVDINDEKYFAYGEQRDAGPVNTENQYTDQKRDDTGLYYYGARYYDPSLGTFISPDAIVPDASHVFGYNRFMYGYGNPMRFIDPSGHDPLDAAWEAEWRQNHCGSQNCEITDTDRQHRLFSIAYAGPVSGSNTWTDSDWYYFTRNRPRIYRNTSGREGLDQFVSALNRLSTHYASNEAAQFAAGVALLYTGWPYDPNGNVFRTNTQFSWGQGMDFDLEHIPVPQGYSRFYPLHGMAGFSPFYHDFGDSGDNTHHFAGHFYLGFHWGANANTAGTFFREFRQWGDVDMMEDIRMGLFGGDLGADLAAGAIPINQVGAFVHARLRDD